MRSGSLAIVAVLAARASADPATADKLVADANDKGAHGDFTGAAAKFREAYAADPRPALTCNVGIAYYKAKDLPRAERYLDDCESTAKSLETKFLDDVAKVHRAVIGKLGAGDFTPVDLNVEPATATATIEGGVPFDEPIVGSRRVWFPAGHYKLVVHAEGFVDQTSELDAHGHVAVAQRIALERAPIVSVGSAGSDVGSGSGDSDAGSGSAITVGSGSGAGSAAIPPLPPRAVLSNRWRRPAIVATVATAALAGASVFWWVTARSRATAAGTQTDSNAYSDDAQAAREWQHLSWLTGGLAGAGAIVSAYLWYRALSGPVVTVEATPGGGAVTLSGRW